MRNDTILNENEYRIKNSIPTIEHICGIPVKYGIGKRPLSRLLGWGEQTFTRYCGGDMPTKQYAEVLRRLYCEPEYFLTILEGNKNLLSPSSYRKSKLAVQSLLGAQNGAESKLRLSAKYILSGHNDITHLALQKSLYYIQGFYYAFNNKFIFQEDCEAWIHGPVYKEIYLAPPGGGSDFNDAETGRHNHSFSTNEKTVIDSVLKHFCRYSGKTLENFTHIETPWLKTRGDLLPQVKSGRVIDKDLIGTYFSNVKDRYNMLTPADIKAYSAEMFDKI